MEKLSSSALELSYEAFVAAHKRRNPTFYSQAVSGKWVIVIPKTQMSRNVSEEFLDSHVLLPPPKPSEGQSVDSTLYTTLNGRTVRVADNKIFGVEGWEGLVESTIMYSETHYDADFNSVRVVNISEPLAGAPSSPKASPSIIVSSHASVSHAWNESVQKDFSFLTSFADAVGALRRLAMRISTVEDTLKKMFKPSSLAKYQKLLDNSIAFVRDAIWRVTNESVDDLLECEDFSFYVKHQQVLRSTLVASLESIILNHMHDELMPLLVELHKDQDRVVGAVSKACSREGYSAAQMVGLDPEIDLRLTSAVGKLRRVAGQKTPVGKLRELKNCISEIAAKAESDGAEDDETGASEGSRAPTVTADDLLPMLMSVILRSKVPRLCAHMAYIQFRQDSSSEMSYYLTTASAALEYIRDDMPEIAGSLDVSGTAEFLSQDANMAEGAARTPTRDLNISRMVVSPPPTNDPAVKYVHKLVAESRSRQRWGVLHELAWRLMDPMTGVDVADRTHYFKTYHRSFVPRRAVKWMVLNVKEIEGDANKAMEIGEALVSRGLVENLTSSRSSTPFIDCNRTQNTFLRLCPLLHHPQQGNRLLSLARKMARGESKLELHKKSVLFSEPVYYFAAPDGINWLMRRYPTTVDTRMKALILLRKLQNAGLLLGMVEEHALVEDSAAQLLRFDTELLDRGMESIKGT